MAQASRRGLCAAVVLAALLLASCGGPKKVRPVPRVFVPPPAVKPVAAAFTSPPEEMPQIEPRLFRLPLPQSAQLPSYPKPRPAPPAPKTPAPAVRPPILRPMLTQAERIELDREIRSRLQRARAVLSSIKGRPLSREQTALAGQVRNFIRQAEEARGTDLLRANNLAERAEVLAADLARRMR